MPTPGIAAVSPGPTSMGIARPAMSAPQPNVVDQAVAQYPILKSVGVVGKITPRAGSERGLESWVPGEPGDASEPRPKEIPLNRMGVEVYSSTVKPIDVLADVVSHHLVKTDPTLATYYDRFQSSLTDKQESILREQYQWSKDKDGEKRPYAQWKAASGMPAYFRGYAFGQWSPEFNAKAYTPQQRAMFDDMMNYLQKGK